MTKCVLRRKKVLLNRVQLAGVNLTKLFPSSQMCKNVSMVAPDKPYHPSLIFSRKAGACLSGAYAPLSGQSPGLSTNTILVWQVLPVTNTPTYFVPPLEMKKKSLISLFLVLAS
jgi:hypothetical protein